MSEMPISPLRARMIEDMSVRKFGQKTQHDYIRHVKTFSTFLGRSPATARGEDLRRYQVQQSQEGVTPAAMNSAVAALRFFFRITLNHPEMGRYLTLVPLPERLRTVLSQEEVALTCSRVFGPEDT
jgi:site-specific recombinase XerD